MTRTNKEISKKIQKLCNDSKFINDPKQVIDDMIQMSFNFLTEPFVIGKAFPRTRYTFKNEMRNELTPYKKDPKVWALLQEIVMDYMQAIRDAEPFSDVIGGMYDEYLGKRLGQFLTPTDVAQACAAICMATMPPLTEPINIGDPCGCGAGSLVLAQLEAIYQAQGKDALKLVNVMVTDIDANMIRMATVQIVLSAMFHRIPLGSFAAFCCNVITEYENSDTLAIYWEPEMTPEKYFETSPEYQALTKLMENVAPYDENEEKLAA